MPCVRQERINRPEQLLLGLWRHPLDQLEPALKPRADDRRGGLLATPAAHAQQFVGGVEPASCAARTGPRITPEGPRGVDVDQNKEAARSLRPVDFRDLVQNRGSWDYKQRGEDFQEFGNYNYGATGRAVGFPKSILLQEAGIAKAAAGTTDQFGRWGTPGARGRPWTGTGSFGDDLADQFWIMQGIRNHDETP